MPIYEYQCKDCGVSVEKRQSVSDEPLKVCEKCGGTLEKQWSLSGFQFKGEGWYVTDYAGKKAGGTDKPAGGDAKEKSSGGESTAASDSASKPASDAAAPKAAPAKDSSTKKD